MIRQHVSYQWDCEYCGQWDDQFIWASDARSAYAGHLKYECPDFKDGVVE